MTGLCPSDIGQKAGRRVAVAVLVSPFALFSKKRKHYLTITYNDENGKEQAGVFELGKDIVRTTLTVLQVRTGKDIECQKMRKHVSRAWGASSRGRAISRATARADNETRRTLHASRRSDVGMRRFGHVPVFAGGSSRRRVGRHITVTCVTGGECLASIFQLLVGAADTGTMQITQWGSSLTAISTSDSDGSSTSYTGHGGRVSLWHSMKPVVPRATFLGATCPSGAQRDYRLQTGGVRSHHQRKHCDWHCRREL